MRQQYSLPISSVLLAIVAILTLVGCEDPVPNDYRPQIAVQAFLFVDEPIREIKLYMTQPLNDSFNVDKATIKNAVAYLTSGSEVIPLRFVADSVGGTYEAVDQSILIEPQKTYTLTVEYDGTKVQGTTTTPPRITWINPPRDTLLYPSQDSLLIAVDSLTLRWTSTSLGGQEYVIALKCLDTLNYGVYLTPPTSDTNKRVNDDDVDRRENFRTETTRYGWSIATAVPTVWNAFKWYGRHTIEVQAADKYYGSWFKQTNWSGGSPSYDYRLSNVTGGLGTVGSAYRLAHDVFLKMRPPAP